MSFVETVAVNLEGVQFFSVGACCKGCDTCAPDVDEPTDEDDEAASEPYFSSSPCDSCNSTLGGDRHPAHGIIADTPEAAQAPESEITHFAICVDCLMYHANGDIPEESEVS